MVSEDGTLKNGSVLINKSLANFDTIKHRCYGIYKT
jgi:hypothetical protein